MYGPSFQDKFEAKMQMSIEPLTMGVAGGAYLAGKGLETYFGQKGAKQSAATQAAAAERGMGTLQELYGQAGQAIAPYQQAGLQGLGGLQQGVMGGEFQTEVPEFGYQPFDFEADPGYQFRLQQGLQGVERGAAARGGALGGGTLKALQQYGQGLASDEYGKAYGRYTGERAFDYGALSDLYNRQVQQQGIQYGGLQQLAGMGQQAAGTQANLATGLGSNLSQLITGQGAAQAAGQAATARAYGGLGGAVSDMGGLMALYGMGSGFQGGGGASQYPTGAYSPNPQMGYA